MNHQFLIRGTFAALALALTLGLTGCNTPADAGTVKPHNPETLDAQHSPGGNPSHGTTPAGSAGSR